MNTSKAMLTTNDVFELAVEIGSEFEKLMKLVPQDDITPLMSKVLRSLESLENFTYCFDDVQTQILEFESTISRLKDDKQGKAADRERFEEEMQDLENTFKNENKQLFAQIQNLREENRKLKKSLEKIVIPTCNHDKELNLLCEIKNTVTQQQEKLQLKDKELDKMRTEIKNQRIESAKIHDINKDIRKKYKESQIQICQLIIDNEQVQCLLTEQNDEILNLRKQLEILEKDTNDILNNVNKPLLFAMDDMKELIYEKSELKVKKLESELKPFKLIEDDPDDLPVPGPINREPCNAP